MTPPIVTASFAHFFTAAFIVSQVGRFYHPALDYAVLGMFAFAAVKEFIIDARTGQSFKGQVIDFLFYGCGTMLAGLLGHL